MEGLKEGRHGETCAALFLGIRESEARREINSSHSSIARCRLVDPGFVCTQNGNAPDIAWHQCLIPGQRSVDIGFGLLEAYVGGGCVPRTPRKQGPLLQNPGPRGVPDGEAAFIAWGLLLAPVDRLGDVLLGLLKPLSPRAILAPQSPVEIRDPPGSGSRAYR